MDDPKDSLDRTLHAGMAWLTRGLSPASLMLAWSDWAVHLAVQPARGTEVLMV
ncbi:MAG TPA: poly-beta-hydroxybutyrate polymerase N-terminal domain-containing protein, partial [Variovorax sp.]|nr:poly-beta-hydroxybutyrate polymerase N-terminal domain-containing protein [Variovorax sp.]